MAHVDSLLSKKRNGEILGKVLEFLFDGESLTTTLPGLSESLYVTILRRLFAEPCCFVQRAKIALFLHGSKPHSYEERDIGEYCQVSLAVSYGLTPGLGWKFKL